MGTTAQTISPIWSKEIFLDIGSFLYVQNFSFIKQNELISEYSTQSIIPGERKLKPISTISSGEIRFEGILVRNILKNRRKIKVNNDDGVLWISSGKIFPLPKEIKYLFPKYLDINKPLAVLKLVTPYSGIVRLKEKTILIDKNKKINIQNLSQIYGWIWTNFKLEVHATTNDTIKRHD